jgi:Na+/H+ antiporter NhaD/arsenite permease-like protein
VLASVDWSLLVFFAGLFVVTGALEHTRLLYWLFALIVPTAQSGVVGLTVVTAALSNLVSNVPAVLILRPLVGHLADPAQGWLTIAMASTLAGNLTLLGSVVNLIVAETASAHGVRLSFWEYLRAGLPITLATLAVGMVWLGVFAPAR